jgi:hypothetical protein
MKVLMNLFCILCSFIQQLDVMNIQKTTTNFIMKELMLKGPMIGQNLKIFQDNIGRFLHQTMTRRTFYLKLKNESSSLSSILFMKKFKRKYFYSVIRLISQLESSFLLHSKRRKNSFLNNSCISEFL